MEPRKMLKPLTNEIEKYKKKRSSIIKRLDVVKKPVENKSEEYKLQKTDL